MKVWKVTTPANMTVTVYGGQPVVLMNFKQTVIVPSNTTTFLFRNDYIFRSIYFEVSVMVAL